MQEKLEKGSSKCLLVGDISLKTDNVSQFLNFDEFGIVFDG